MSIKAEINKAYVDYIHEQGYTPNAAYVKVHWKSDQEESDYTEIIAIVGVDAIHDDDILFYCNSLQGLIGLTNEGSGEDFIVTRFIGFDNIE